MRPALFRVSEGEVRLGPLQILFGPLSILWAWATIEKRAIPPKIDYCKLILRSFTLPAIKNPLHSELLNLPLKAGRVR